MKKNILYMLFAALPIAYGCSDSDEPISRTQTTITLEYPEGYDDMQVTNERITFRNQKSGRYVTVSNLEAGNLPAGLYDCTYSADVTYTVSNDQGESATVRAHLTGKSENIEITGTAKTIAIEVFVVSENEDFIFEEIFFTGTLRESGSQYYGDSYVKIYNNTDHVLYADGLVFAESKFKSTQLFEFTPDIRKDTMTIWSMYVVPGNGTEHPVLPGQSMIICDTGIDHRVANPNSFDLSSADFEWYDLSTQPAHMDIDSPTVPNMDKWYCYTLSFYLLHNRGFTSFALARIPADIGKEQYLKDYFYRYSYVQHTQVGDFYMEQEAYKLPNAWIIDGVNCSIEASRLWNILPPSVDAGWTHCGTIDHDKTRYFKSIRRKMQYLNPDGTMHLQDTNNSTADFNTECTPSLVEQQGTATDAAGTKATTRTYDGVTPIR
ncbi:MAG: DUF4876 domain-containing protein [Bacteroidaceae bacterium]|nr:DUF4876 domain-containing protein [Bacteroidaceae bacterium]MBR1467696.1 DUF4876 domain-containing protein [Bacteroidaceae bacterium]